MSLSKVDICNIALAHLGEAAIRALDDPSRRARLCQTAIDAAIKTVLSDLDWNFARRLKKLHEVLDVTPPAGYYAYALPSDCVVPRELHPRGSRRAWEINGTNLVTNIDPETGVHLYYTAAEIPVASYPHTFSIAVAAYTAFFMAPSLVADQARTRALYEMYRIAASDAWHIDANIGNDYIPMDGNANYDSFVDVGE